MLNRLRSFDLYPKTLEEFREKTWSGAAVSIISLTIIAFLVITEFIYYLRIDRYDALYVDTSDAGKISIYLNMTFPSMSCDVISLDVMDVTGDHQLDVEHSLYKTRVDGKTGRPLFNAVLQKGLGEGADGSTTKSELDEKTKKALEPKPEGFCGSCFGAEDPSFPCCNNCDDIRTAYRKKGWAFTPDESMEQCYADALRRKLRAANREGCNLAGIVTVNKVAGNFHIAPGHSFQTAHSHVHDFMPFETSDFNSSHTIHRLGFGIEYPGLVNPLDNRSKEVMKGTGLFQYYIKVVPTVYEYLDGKQLVTNQYSVTENVRIAEKDANFMPGVFFMYDLSPIMVNIHEERKSFVTFLTSLCAITGGVFTVAGLIDSAVHSSIRSFKRKAELGKIG